MAFLNLVKYWLRLANIILRSNVNLALRRPYFIILDIYCNIFKYFNIFTIMQIYKQHIQYTLIYFIILLKCKITVFSLNIFKNVIYC